MLNDDAGRETNVTTANVCRTSGQTGCVEPPSELYVYIKTKQRHGNEIERAGLTNGYLYGVRVVDKGTVVTGENKDFVFGSSSPVTSARFELHNFFDVSGLTGVGASFSRKTSAATTASAASTCTASTAAGSSWSPHRRLAHPRCRLVPDDGPEPQGVGGPGTG